MYGGRFITKCISAFLCVVLLCGLLPTMAFGNEAETVLSPEAEIVNGERVDDLSESDIGVPEEGDDLPLGTGGAEDEAGTDDLYGETGTENKEDSGISAVDEQDENESDESSDEPASASEEISVSEEPETVVDGDGEYQATTTAILTQDSGTTKKIVLESYLTSAEDAQQTIKPCDIIFVVDQSKWMNTVEDSGAQRAAIISELKTLLEDLAEPTTGGEHRVAIAGYGRINMSADTDPYSASIYPGLKATGNNISLNTGYYTADGFVSQNGWSDISQSAMSGSGLPQMAVSYKTAMTYDRAFMTLDEADAVLNEDTMLAWYAGASRMDAGLTIAEQLAAIAEENDPNDDRNLIVCILASSLPIQNTVYKNLSTIRTAAVLVASAQLKDEGATIFAFGDYHASGKQISGDIQDTEETFTDIMEQVCTESDYFYSFSDFSSVTDALNQMITQIIITAAGEAEQDHTVQVQELDVIDSEEEKTITWQSVLDYYGSGAQSVISNTMARVEYYYFTGYDSEGEPTFETEPYISLNVPLEQLVTDEGLSYESTLIPLPSWEAEQNSAAYSRYGSKVTITIAAPVTVTYRWASSAEGYAPSNVALPASETVALGTAHAAAGVKVQNGTYDEHYVFVGWYTDEDCTREYTGTDAVSGDITLYGKWDRYVLVEYYWNIWETDYETADDDARVKSGETPEIYEPEGPGGYIFEGWYLDKACTQLYEPAPLTADLQLYAKWVAEKDTPYTVHYYQQNEEDDGYTEIEDDEENLTGVTDEAISEITKVYEGFTLGHITYEDTSHTPQSDPLPINGDGSLVVRVYYDRGAYQVTYEGNGSDGGTVPTDDEIYGYSAEVTVAQAMVTRQGYAFAQWNTAEDGSGTGYDPGDTFAITEDTTLYAQWAFVWELDLQKQSDSGSALSGALFALYTNDPTSASSEDDANASDSGEAQRQLTIDDTTWYLLDVRYTDAEGIIQWSGLTAETYYLLELEAPEGYDLGDQTDQVVEVDSDGVQEVTVVNARTYVPYTPQTGISGLNTGIYAMVAGSAAVLLVAGAVNKRRKRKKG